MIGRKVLNNRQKGITLISLVITVLVLLILATVSIATITGDNGILSRATKTAKMANDTEAREQVEVSVLRSFDERGEIDLDELNKNLSKIPGLKYNGKSLGSGNKIDKLPVTLEVDGYEITIDEEGNVLGTLLAGQTSQLTQKDNYKDESGNTATIPKGFTVSDTENKVDTGLVVTDSKGNEFVWVPVPDISTMATFDGSNYHDKDNREPIWQTVDTENIQGNPNVNQETMQSEYNKMIESVDKYKGFYIGRYEMSFNALSKKGEKSISSSDYVPEWTYKAWYGLSGLIGNSDSRRSDDSVVPDMMWAGQYDWMMNWMEKAGVNVNSSTPVLGASPNKEHINGSTESDKINNVYDLLGNRKYEWTQGVNGTYRVYTNSDALADTHMNDPMTESEDLGTRVTLYIKDNSAYNTQDYTGYYADVNGDGNVDGIIYNDLAKSSASGTFKKYTVGQEVGGFGTWKKPMISPVKGSSGNDRFKVMALEDVFCSSGPQMGNSWYWYHDAVGNSTYADAIGNLTKDQKNSGKYMTSFMIDAWNSKKFRVYEL